MKLKNILLAFPLQVPLMFAVVFGVHFLTGLSICRSIAATTWHSGTQGASGTLSTPYN